VQRLVQDDPRFDWRNARSLTEMNIRDLNLEQGTAYAVVIRAVNGAGLSSIGLSAPVTVDITPPEAPEISGFAQQTVSGKPNSFRFSLGSPADPESGILSTSVALGTSEGSADLVARTELAEAGGEAQSLALVNVPVSAGQTVYLTVRSVNGAEASSEISESVTVQFDDTTPPAPVEAALQPAPYTVDPDSLTVGWSSSADEESGIVRYEFGLGSSPGEPDVVGWTAVPSADEPRLIGLKSGGTGTGFGGRYGTGDTGGRGPEGSGSSRGGVGVSGSGVLSGRLMQEGALEAEYQRELNDLGLQQGGSYYLLVRAVNGVGLTSAASAGPVTVDTTAPVQTRVIEVALNEKQNTLDLEVQARDPQSGIASLRWEAVRGGHGAFSFSEVLASSSWLTFTGPGTSSKGTVKRQIKVNLPADARRSGKGALRVRVWVMNGAGLTVRAGSWPQTASSGSSGPASTGFQQPGSPAADAIGNAGGASTMPLPQKERR
jgi:hypothetical protein